MSICAATAFGQTSSSSPYVPGVTYQSANPNYPVPNPFFFEGRIDWNLLKITTPSNAWEFAERGMYKQDDLGDIPGAMADYKQSVAMNNTGNATCQIVTAPLPASGGPLSPPPCMFTMRLRLAGLLRESAPQDAIALYEDVLKIDALRLGVHAAIGETYSEMAAAESDAAKASTDFNQAIAEFQAELALSPVTELTTSVTGDLANNAHVHWELAEIYHHLDDSAQEATELDLYLKATQWHSDTYPWRINLAKARLAAMGGAPLVKPRTPARPRSPESEKRKSEQ